MLRRRFTLTMQIKYPKEIAGLLLTTFNWKVLSYSELAYYKQLAYYLYYYPSSVWPRDELMIRYFGRVQFLVFLSIILISWG